jgi:hypothetical protein
VDKDLDDRLQHVLVTFHEGKCLKDLAALFRRRASKHRFYGHPAAFSVLAAEPNVVRSGASAAQEFELDILSGDLFEAYVPEDDLASLVEKHYLMQSGRADPNVVLRSIASPWPFAPHSPVAPLAAVALDLLESDDPRHRQAGTRLAEKAKPVMSLDG